MELIVLKLNKEVVYATKKSAGFDIECDGLTVLHPRETKVIPTTLKITDSSDAECILILPRSSSSKKALHVHTGLIDGDYRGDFGITVTNLSEVTHRICTGDKIAQGLVLSFHRVANAIVKDKDRLGGWGSTDDFNT